MFLKWHFVWKHVENVSEYQIDQIGWKNIKIQHFPIFPSLQKNNFQKLSNFEYIYGHKCPPIGLFWRIFFGFFFSIPKQRFGASTETHRNSISVELPNWTEISVEHYLRPVSILHLLRSQKYKQVTRMYERPFQAIV